MTAAHAELDLRSPQLKAKPRRRINKVEEENRQNLLKLFVFIMVLITALTNLPFYAGKVLCNKRDWLAEKSEKFQKFSKKLIGRFDFRPLLQILF